MAEQDADGGASAEDPLAAAILAAAAGGPVAPDTVARAFFEQRRRPADPPDAWRRYLAPVKQQALALARAGRLHILRKGVVVPPEDAKGLIKYSLADRHA